jgi:dTDP-4-dehydrorhamnose 3,5-epimerase
MTTTAVPDVAVSLLGTRDEQTVDPTGRHVGRGIDGVEVQRARPFIDPRGSLIEVVNFEDPFWREPIVYSYSMTVNPGRIKGWGMHLRQVDRHHVHAGSVRFVLYDARTDSPTHGHIAIVCLGDEARGAVRIPAGVWHAAQNYGSSVAHITNFPTIAYDHSAPDKQLLPIGTDLIPFDFGDLDTYGR